MDWVVSHLKLAVDGQNLIYCVRFEENVQKPPKKADFWKCANIVRFWTMLSHSGKSQIDVSPFRLIATIQNRSFPDPNTISIKSQAPD